MFEARTRSVEVTLYRCERCSGVTLEVKKSFQAVGETRFLAGSIGARNFSTGYFRPVRTERKLMGDGSETCDHLYSISAFNHSLFVPCPSLTTTGRWHFYV